MHLLVSTLLFCLFTVSGVLLYVPQLVLLARGGDASALSVSSLLSGVVNYAAWDVYLGLSHAWMLLVTNTLSLVVWYALTALALRRLPLTGACLAPLAWLALLVALVLVDRSLLGPVLGFGSLLTVAPQAISVWTVPSVAGLSPTTWTLLAVQGVAWLVQSLPTGLVGGIVYGVVASAGSASVLSALALRGRAIPAVADVVPRVRGDLPAPATTDLTLAS
ncbi:hypothetical protein GCM10009844_10150 [Nocardioides koreensis]|uniref:Uncharacterized protein n=1 Tax=Nocardioides koreensis TaxID=433651 RepID=A0ABP5L1K1_9ACTN